MTNQGYQLLKVEKNQLIIYNNLEEKVVKVFTQHE